MKVSEGEMCRYEGRDYEIENVKGRHGVQVEGVKGVV